jgi:glutathione S-transferase
MDEIEIMGFAGGNFVRAVRMAAEEKQIPYRFTKAQPQTPEVMAIHPLGKVPVMRHGEVKLCESRAIVGYFERVFPSLPLLPEDPIQSALAEQWISIINTSIDRTMIREYALGHIFPKGPAGQPDQKAIDAAAADMRTQIGALEAAVGASGFLVGNAFTYADIVLLPILDVIQKFPEGRDALASSPGLAAYLAEHSQRPSFARARPN